MGNEQGYAIARMRRAIYEYVILGVKTTLPLHHAIIHNPEFIAGNTHTHFLQEEHISRTLKRYIQEEETRMTQLATPLRADKKLPRLLPDLWRLSNRTSRTDAAKGQGTYRYGTDRRDLTGALFVMSLCVIMTGLIVFQCVLHTMTGRSCFTQQMQEERSISFTPIHTCAS